MNPEVVMLLVDGLSSKTRRLAAKALSLLESNQTLLVATIVDRCYAFPHVEYIGESQIIFGNLHHIAEAAGAGYNNVSILALNESVLVSALALAKLLGIAPRMGILATCNKAQMRGLLSKDPEFSIEYAIVDYQDPAGDDYYFNAASYIVKPAYGMSGNSVRIYNDWSAALEYARSGIPTRGWVTTECKNILGSDLGKPDACVIEPYVPGTEFSIDGYLHNGQWNAIVHQKLEIKYNHTFGDGITVSPPIPAKCIAIGLDALHNSEAVIKDFGLNALLSIGFKEGVFHIEGRERSSDHKLILIEINARAPGGSLWRSAFLRTGYDLELIDAAIQLGMQPKKAQLGTRHNFVMHMPFYADKPGVIRDWGDIAPNACPHPTMIIDYAAEINKVIEPSDLNEECYLAFAVSHADTLDQCVDEIDRMRMLRGPTICKTLE